MNMSINVIVDSDYAARSALPGVGLPSTKSIDLTSEEMSEKIQKAIKSVASPVESAVSTLPNLELEKLTFTLAITSTGEVSLLSAVKAGVSIQTGLQITLIPRKNSI
jgi:actin-like ATPase involved in cell morphogenesis